MCVRMPFNENPQHLVVVLGFFEVIVLFVFVGIFSMCVYIYICNDSVQKVVFLADLSFHLNNIKQIFL